LTLPRESLEILWQDDHLVAVMKPAGLATIPGRAETDSVFERLAVQLGLPTAGAADPRLRVVHRLDKPTSGVLLFAKDIVAQRHLSHQFQNNLAAKEYLAIVAGSPEGQTGQIDAPLAPHRASPERMTISASRGRGARTDWQVEDRFVAYALLRVFPKTGKTHQIRVHLQSIGLPLAVDPLYNPPPAHVPPGIFLSVFKRDYHGSAQAERPLIDRLTLHAEKLRFTDLSGNMIEVIAPLPKDFRAVLNQLRKYSRRP
jgi:23S rRNA pseudouridine955/2504/2580 synthase/23S rRNA pseudouridine1911/1915/1917 synthase